jgi:hypothetical protein
MGNLIDTNINRGQNKNRQVSMLNNEIRLNPHEGHKNLIGWIAGPLNLALGLGKLK